MPVTYLACIVILGITVVPLLYVFLDGARSTAQISNSSTALPNPWVWSNYGTILSSASFWQFLGNSALIAGVATALAVGLGSMVAFALSRYAFRGREVVYTLFITGILFPIGIAALPLFLQLQLLGLLDNQFDGDGAHERAQDEDRDRQRERCLRQRHAELVVQQAHQLELQEQRQRGYLEGEQQAADEQRVEDLPAAEGIPGQRERRHRAESHCQRGRDPGDQRAVPEELPERRAAEDRAVVRPDPRVRQRGRAGADLGGAAGAVQEHVQQRHHRDSQDHDARQVGGRHDRPPA